MVLQTKGKGNLELVKHLILTWRWKNGLNLCSFYVELFMRVKLSKYLTVFCTGSEKTTVILFQHRFLKASMPHLRAIIQTC